MKPFTLIILSILLIMIRTNFAFPNKFEQVLKNPITEFTEDVAKYFLQFSGHAYCLHQHIKNNACCSFLTNEHRWELVAAANHQVYDYNFIIHRHDEYKKIVVSLPGTRTYEELWDIVKHSGAEEYKKNPNYKIVGFFYEMFLKIKKKFKTNLKLLYKENPGYQVIFTGHSLGGAMASILALNAVETGIIKKTATSPMLITYGQPRTGNDIFANDVMKNVPLVYRVVRNGDLVASLPTCEWNFLGTECISVLQDSKFDGSFECHKELQTFNAWHIGGLKLFNRQMTKYNECGVKYGENNPKESCNPDIRVSMENHCFYFDAEVAHMCIGN
jgi:hypothetical protein